MRLDNVLKTRIEGEDGVSYLSTIENLRFDPNSDLINCDEIFWSDGDHWSEAGELRFGARLKEALNRALQ